MCWIDSQSKKLLHLKYLILETAYTIFAIFSWYFSFTHTKYSITLFSGIKTATFRFFA